MNIDSLEWLLAEDRILFHFKFADCLSSILATWSGFSFLVDFSSLIPFNFLRKLTHKKSQ